MLLVNDPRSQYSKSVNDLFCGCFNKMKKIIVLEGSLKLSIQYNASHPIIINYKKVSNVLFWFLYRREFWTTVALWLTQWPNETRKIQQKQHLFFFHVSRSSLKVTSTVFLTSPQLRWVVVFKRVLRVCFDRGHNCYLYSIL